MIIIIDISLGKQTCNLAVENIFMRELIILYYNISEMHIIITLLQ